MIRVLVVDDSPVIHKLIEDVWREAYQDRMTLVHKYNGAEAVEYVKQEEVDVITMDIEMPVMDGLTAIKKIMETNPRPIIVFSAATRQVASLVMDALDAGAVDVVEKPDTDNVGITKQFLRSVLFQKILLYNGIKVVRRINQDVIQSIIERKHKLEEITLKKKSIAPFHEYPVVGIASSTGGPQTLKKIFSHVHSLTYPVIVIQHIPHGFIEGLMSWLSQTCNIQCAFAEENQTPKRGYVYFVNQDSHLVFQENGSFHFLNTPPVFGIRPAANYFFESLGRVYKEKAIGIVLTGMGEDGCEGARIIKSQGGTIISEAEEDCIVYGMPKAVAEAGLSDKVMRLTEIADFLNRLSTQFP